MSATVQNRLIPVAEWTVIGLGLATALSGGAFVWALATRAADALLGWNYHFQSIGDYLGVQLGAGEPGRKFLEWDRSFLLLGAAMVTGYSASGVQGFIDWAQKSPEQRTRARLEAREAIANVAKSEREKKRPAKRRGNQ